MGTTYYLLVCTMFPPRSLADTIIQLELLRPTHPPRYTQPDLEPIASAKKNRGGML